MVVWSRRNSVQNAQDQRYDVLQSSSSEYVSKVPRYKQGHLFDQFRHLGHRPRMRGYASERTLT
jgi:hypothetical protein